MAAETVSMVGRVFLLRVPQENSQGTLPASVSNWVYAAEARLHPPSSVASA